MKKSRWMVFAAFLLFCLTTMMVRHQGTFRKSGQKPQAVFTPMGLAQLEDNPHLVTAISAPENPRDVAILITDAKEPPGFAQEGELTLTGFQIPSVTPPLPQTSEPPLDGKVAPVPAVIDLDNPPLGPNPPPGAGKKESPAPGLNIDLVLKLIDLLSGSGEKKKSPAKEDEKKNTLTIGIGINFSTGPILRIDYKGSLEKPQEPAAKEKSKQPGKLLLLPEGKETGTVTPAKNQTAPNSNKETKDNGSSPLSGKQSAAPSPLLPLTGTFPCLIDAERNLVVPKEVLAQLGEVEKVLVSPGSDTCLWITTPEFLIRLNDRLEKSSATDQEVLAFRRLFFGQIEKVPLQQGKLRIPDRLGAFASLETQVALVGVEDHLELWDLKTWRNYLMKPVSPASPGGQEKP
ncbi:MAG: hypothetical protein EXR99_07510 [Gemmataceae bacterium]|nr:hypothetical protein [Gemmataceae bacterium]